MLKRQSRHWAIGLIFFLVISLFAGADSASAAGGGGPSLDSDNIIVAIGRTPTINVNLPAGTEYELATLTITEGTNGLDGFAAGDYFYVKLPSGIRWQSTPSDYVSIETRVNDTWVAASPTDCALQVVKSTSAFLYIQVERLTGHDTTQERIVIKPMVEADGFGGSQIEATIQDVNGRVPGGSYKIAVATNRNTHLTAMSTPTVADGEQNLGVIRIVEIAADVFQVNSQIYLTLPTGITWNQTQMSQSNSVSLQGGMGSGHISWQVDANSEKRLILTIDDPETWRTNPGIIEIKTPVVIANQASFGDIEVVVESTIDTAETLRIGVYSDRYVNSAATSVATLISGQLQQQGGTLEFAESVRNVLPINSTIEITMPDGVKIANDDVRIITRLGSTIINSADIEISPNKVTVPIGNIPSSAAATIAASFNQLDVAPDFQGDVIVHIGGSAGVSDNVKIAEVLPALSALVSPITNIQHGTQNQPSSNIIFTEAQAQALSAGNLIITAASGVTWAKVPTVAVTSGDLQMNGSVTLDVTNQHLIIPVGSISNTGSSLTIGNIELNVADTVPVGDVLFTISGPAVASSSAIFDHKVTAFTFVAAKCTDPSTNPPLGGGGGGGGVVEKSAEKTILIEGVLISYSIEDKTAAITLNQGDVQKIAQAGSGGVLFDLTEIKDTQVFNITFNPAWFKDTIVTIQTPFGNLVLSQDLLQEFKNKNVGLITLTLSKGSLIVSISQDEADIEWYDYRHPLLISLAYEQTKEKTNQAVMVQKMAGTNDQVIPRSWYQDQMVYAKVYGLGAFDAINRNPEVFFDTQGKWMDEAVSYMAARTIVSGMGANTFSPDTAVTWAEYTQMVMQTLNIKLPADLAANEPFADVAANAWYFTSVNTAKALGIVGGDADGNFHPDQPITREDMFGVTYKAMQITNMLPKQLGLQPVVFSDMDEVKATCREAVYALAGQGYISGYSGAVYPKDISTRAQAAQFLYEVLKKDQYF